MERLTSNKPVSEMDMYELAHNSCYIKDGKVRVRGFENDSDARELTRKIFENIADDPFIDDTDEIFDEVITDYLQYGTSNLVGLIAVFYQNLCATANLRERLKKYEDLEEQGKLPKLPCAVGDTVYVIPSETNYKLNIINGHSENNRVYEQIVIRIEISNTGYLFVTCDGMASVVDTFYKKTWFLSRGEAKAALNVMAEKTKRQQAQRRRQNDGK